MDRYYSPTEIAATLKMNVNSIYEYIRMGKLPAVRLGNRYKISENDLKEFLDRCRPLRGEGSGTTEGS
jgi:excisionase family DNA binding protein